MDVFAFLRSTEILADFDDQALRRLSDVARIEEYSFGQVVLRLGQIVNTVGLVVSGTLEVQPPFVGPKAKPAILSEGMLFGEMSLLTGEPAVAEVKAGSPARVIHIPQTDLNSEIARAPKQTLRLARLLAERLSFRAKNPEEQAMVGRARSEAQSRLGTLPEDARDTVLVLNLGSSSIKYALFANGERRAGGLVDRIGLGRSELRHSSGFGEFKTEIPAENHEQGLKAVFEALLHPAHGGLSRLEDLSAVGHRTVHGGVRFTEAAIATDDVKEELRRCSALAPLHNPINLLGIELCEKMLPEGVPQVCVFDTAFHMTMPEHAYRYALPKDLADKNNLRRFGFHGTSHKYVSRAALALLGEQENALRMITCHLGNGCSVTAVDHGRSVDTSMGLTPLEGLVMGTRSGDLDPGVILHLLSRGMSREEIDRILNKKSGLLGLSGLSSDMRELEKAADAGHAGALLAISIFCYRVRKYIGAYTAAMGGLDALVFTGGIGENAAGARSRICNGLACLGIEIDEELNRKGVDKKARGAIISKQNAKIKILVVRTDEEAMIATDAIRALERSGITEILKIRRDTPIPIGVSAHHVHLCRRDMEALFGKGREVTPESELTQPGQFACAETVDLVGPKGRVDRARILGPIRNETQVEISRTEEFKLGIDAPIRASGDIKGSPGLTLVGPEGEVKLKEGVICAFRHIHMSPADALSFGLRDRDLVRVKVEGERSLIFGDVLVRVHPDFKLEMHIDTDEANAAEVHPGMNAAIDSIQRRSA